ncbi:MAG: MMPL family transporter [Verrucomicrobia bacterium]|nr:MMPL family transporter [Verrucomicrobiota bacterium]
MKKLFLLSYDHPWMVLCLVVLLTGISGIFALRLRVDVSMDALIPMASSKIEGYEKAKKLFGSDVVAGVYVKDPALFTVARLQVLRQVYDDLIKIDGVEKTESLFTINNIRNDGGAIDTNPLLDSLPATEDEAAQKKKHALDNPLIRGRLVSLNGQSTIITLYLADTKQDPKFSKNVHDAIEAVLDRHVGKCAEAPWWRRAPDQHHSGKLDDVFQIGAPFVETSMTDYLLNDQVLLLPISALVLLLFIGYSLNSYLSAVVPLSNAMVSTFWTGAVMYWLGLPINFLTYTIPAMMIVIGSLEDIHIVAAFLEARRETGDSREAVGLIGRRLGMIMICTSLTTIIGFGSNAFTDLPAMYAFGIGSAIAMTFNFLATILMAPAYLRILGSRIRHGEQHSEGKQQNWAEQVSGQLGKFVIHSLIYHPQRMYLGLCVCLIPAAFFMFKIELNNDLFSFFKKESSIIVRNDVLQKNLTGARLIYVQLNKEPGAFKASQNMQIAEKATKYLKGIEDKGVKEFDSVTSITDYIALINREMNEGNEKFDCVPDNDKAIAQYLLLLQRKDIERYVSGDFASVNIVVRHNINSSTHLNELIGRIERELGSGRLGALHDEKTGKDLFRITGKDVLVADGVDSIATGQVSSISVDIIIIVLMMSGVFLSWRAGLLSMVPNLIPIVFIFGVMGCFHVPLNIGTSMVGAICIGIAVDDTIHFMLTYNQHLKTLGSEKAALEETISGEVLPVIVSAAALAAGFFVLGFSSFVPVAQFGTLCGICMLLAVFVDLGLTPILLSTVRLITLWEVVGLKLQESVIRTSLLFQDMQKWQVRRLVLASNLIEFPPDYRLITEGNEGDSMFVVLEGELAVLKNINGKEQKVSQLKAGDVVGEIALICKEKRTASVVSETWVKLLAVDWNSLEKLRRWMPYIACTFFLNISRILGTRLIHKFEKSQSTRP